MTGGGFERHPLANYFFTWIRETALFFSGGKKDVNFRLALSLISALTVSLSVLQIFKYLRNIIGLPLFLNLLLVVFFSLFSTSILLSFTPETYTYTLFFLVLFNYYAALKLKKNDKAYNDRGHFFAVAALAMKHILISQAQKKKLEMADVPAEAFTADDRSLMQEIDMILDIDQRLQQVSELCPRLAEVFVFRFFSGMTLDEISDILNVHVRTIDRDWKKVKTMMAAIIAK